MLATFALVFFNQSLNEPVAVKRIKLNHAVWQ